MDITLYISRFLYRIRHQLIFGTLIVTALVVNSWRKNTP